MTDTKTLVERLREEAGQRSDMLGFYGIQAADRLKSQEKELIEHREFRAHVDSVLPGMIEKADDLVAQLNQKEKRIAELEASLKEIAEAGIEYATERLHRLTDHPADDRYRAVVNTDIEKMRKVLE